MTRLEMFAAAALTGLSRTFNRTDLSLEGIVIDCFSLAEAMEEEAKRREGKGEKSILFCCLSCKYGWTIEAIPETAVMCPNCKTPNARVE